MYRGVLRDPQCRIRREAKSREYGRRRGAASRRHRLPELWPRRRCSESSVCQTARRYAFGLARPFGIASRPDAAIERPEKSACRRVHTRTSPVTRPPRSSTHTRSSANNCRRRTRVRVGAWNQRDWRMQSGGWNLTFSSLNQTSLQNKEDAGRVLQRVPASFGAFRTQARALRLSPNAAAAKSRPISPTSGSELAVFGNCAVSAEVVVAFEFVLSAGAVAAGRSEERRV